MKPLKTVELFTDGACANNPGTGGWAAILRYGKREKTVSGGEAQTTNNRMELIAVIEGLKALKEPCSVLLYTDSKYVSDGLSKGWARSWKKNGWKKSDKSPALNADLWDTLLPLCDMHSLDIRWIKGHAGHPENERCDAIARAEISKIKKENADE